MKSLLIIFAVLGFGPGGFGDLKNEKYGYIDKTGKVIWQPTK